MGLVEPRENEVFHCLIYGNIDVSLNKDSPNKDNSPIVISGQQTGGLLQLQEAWKKLNRDNQK